MKILGISGSLSEHSKTELTIRTALQHLEKSRDDVKTEVVALSDYDLVFCDGRDPAKYEGDTRAVLDKIEEADAYIIGSPIYRGTYTGALKNLFDLIPNDALKGKVVGIIATGGSNHHFLAIEHQFKPIFGFFKAIVVPTAVYANNGHFSDGVLSDRSVIERLENLAEETLLLATQLSPDYQGSSYPKIKRKSLTAS